MTTQLTLFVHPAPDLGNDDQDDRRTYRPLDEPIICPSCEMHWTTDTRVSWWHNYDRCYSCMRDVVGDQGRCLTADEMRPFELRYYQPVNERPGFAWRCLDCTWRSRSRGPAAHEHVRIHHIVTGHALACREIVA